MRIAGYEPSVTFDMNGEQFLTFRVDREYRGVARTIVNKYHGAKVTVETKRFTRQRSNDANAYAWVLIGKLAAELRQSKMDVYRHFIRDIGGNYEIVPIRNDAVEAWRRNWQQNGDGWVCDVLAPAKTDGYTNVICYYGSSTYDTAQMSVLIDAIIAECKDADIETLPPRELDRMMEGWHEKKVAQGAGV